MPTARTCRSSASRSVSSTAKCTPPIALAARPRRARSTASNGRSRSKGRWTASSAPSSARSRTNVRCIARWNRRSRSAPCSSLPGQSRCRLSRRSRSRGVVLPAPELLEPAVAAASRPIEFVAQRIFQIIVLMIVLGGPERRRRHDLGYDPLLEAARLGQLGLRRLREALLLLVVIEDGAAVLVAVIAELRIGRDRVDVVPEHVEQLRIADLGGGVCQLDGFRVPGRRGPQLLAR